MGMTTIWRDDSVRNVCWVIILICLMVGPVAARDIYVDNLAGDDKNTGKHAQGQGDADSPVRTIAKALRLAHAGDRVVLAKTDQPYRECVSLVGTRHSGAGRLVPFVLDGQGATLDGSAPIPALGWTHYRDNIFRFRPKSLFQPVVFLQGRAIAPMPLAFGTDCPPRLKSLEWCAIEGAVFLGVAADQLPTNYKLSYAELPTGITLYQVDQVVIRNLTIQGFRADGLVAAVGARDVVLENVTCTANGQNGVCVQGGAQVEIEKCKLAGNGLAQLLTLANSETHLLAGAMADDTVRGWANRGGRVYLGLKPADDHQRP
jgi:hypothetical protein